MQLPRRGAGRGGLGGVLLGLAQFGDRNGQGHQVRDERDSDERGVGGDLACQCHQPRSGAQLPFRGHTQLGAEAPRAA